MESDFGWLRGVEGVRRGQNEGGEVRRRGRMSWMEREGLHKLERDHITLNVSEGSPKHLDP